MVWTDTFQCVLMILGQVLLIFMGCKWVGGFYHVWDINSKWQRLLIELDPDPTIRLSMWSAIIGGAFLGMVIYSI